MDLPRGSRNHNRATRAAPRIARQPTDRPFDDRGGTVLMGNAESPAVPFVANPRKNRAKEVFANVQVRNLASVEPLDDCPRFQFVTGYRVLTKALLQLVPPTNLYTFGRRDRAAPIFEKSQNFSFGNVVLGSTFGSSKATFAYPPVGGLIVNSGAVRRFLKVHEVS